VPTVTKYDTKGEQNNSKKKFDRNGRKEKMFLLADEC
jgi:hypothetical protein